MAGLLAASMVVVMALCLARLFRAPVDDPSHRRDLDGWHALMALAMAAMLVATYTRAASLLALAVFVVGVVWSIVHGSAPGARTAYLRLGLGCTAMAAMLLPAATASATATASEVAPTQPTGHAGHHAAHLIQAAPGGSVPMVPPTVLVIALLTALAVVLVVGLRGALRESDTHAGRVGAACDVAMAAAMGYMLVAFL
jgi:hypothetical protein